MRIKREEHFICMLSMIHQFPIELRDIVAPVIEIIKSMHAHEQLYKRMNNI